MSATFRAYRLTRLGDCDMAYSQVHRIRMILLGYAGAICGRGAEWSLWYERMLRHFDVAEWDELYREINKAAEDRYTDGEAYPVLIGIVMFCNHSDCDGWFDECEYIAKALRATLDNTKHMGEWDRNRMENLYEVFQKASEDDCRVELF